jgi:predicted RNA-binding protein associated with RNAse of E/G family
LIFDKDKHYDIMAIILPDGTKKEVWFDITDFYGREDE